MTHDEAGPGAPAPDDASTASISVADPAASTSVADRPDDPASSATVRTDPSLPPGTATGAGPAHPSIHPDGGPSTGETGTSPALGWVDADRLTTSPLPAPVAGRGDLLADGPRRSGLRPGTVVPLALLLAAAATYTTAATFWPLHSVAPSITPVAFAPAPAPSASIDWPAAGSAAVGIEGIGQSASASSRVPMASITKVITVLAALERLPLSAGEQGPSFSFTQEDSDDYWNYLAQDQSALDVPVDGSLTEYQLLQGILLGSANNYADRLAKEVWGTDGAFAAAAEDWLRQNDLSGITVENASGFGLGNTATPSALLRLGEIAVHHPIVGEIVATPQADIPGAGVVTNSNKLLGEQGFIGIKTGTIGDTGQEDFNLLSAREITMGGTTVRVYASVLGQPDDETRYAVSRSLYADAEAELRVQAPTVPRGTVLGTIKTAWGENVDAVAAMDSRVVLWNGASADLTTSLALGDDWTEGADAGTLSVTGPVDVAKSRIALSTTLHGPDLWWRLTHPLKLFGLDAG